MRVEWLPEARESLLDIVDFISDRSIRAASELNQTIEDAVKWLPTHPYLYKKGRVPSTREMVVHPNYIVVYRVGLTAVQIVNVLHARQQYPRD